MKEENIPFHYRNYLQEPLSENELCSILKKLGKTPKEMLRKSDKAYKQLGLTGQENDEVLIKHMATYPGLLQRPIVIKSDKAILGRPLENLLEFVSS